MTVYDVLKNDHRKVEDIFSKIKKSENTEEKRSLFLKLKEELEAHSKAEERTLYERLEHKKKTHDKAIEAEEEHHLVDILLGELASMSPEEERWPAKLEVLEENIKHHVTEEENALFTKAQDVLSEDEADALGEQIKEVKSSLKTKS